jgi:hypothetical protein
MVFQERPQDIRCVAFRVDCYIKRLASMDGAPVDPSALRQTSFPDAGLLFRGPLVQRAVQPQRS